MKLAPQLSSKKIIYLTAGAGGMFCGSCLHDNALTKALIQAGWDVQLVPTYTPIRTDEEDVSVDRVLFGGLNVYLQEKVSLFRHLPMFLDRFLNNPRLIRRVTARAIDTDAATLGSLALSMLKGTDGNQRKEVRRLVNWLKAEKPDLLILTNLLIGGSLNLIKRHLNIPVLVTLQGDDVFLDSLKSPYREKCLEEIKKLVRHVDGFIVHSQFFRDYMSLYFEIDPARIHVTPLGIDVKDFVPRLEPIQIPQRSNSETRTIGYLARLAPEKGLHQLAQAFVEIKRSPEFADVKLKIAGWLGPPNLQYAEDIWDELRRAGLSNEFHYIGAIERSEKLKFLSEIDILCVPTVYREPKGLYALEAMAAGVPVVVPDHGAFPELIQDTGGGRLFEPGNIESLENVLCELLRDASQRQLLGQNGQADVHQHRNAASMAQTTGELLAEFLT